MTVLPLGGSGYLVAPCNAAVLGVPEIISALGVSSLNPYVCVRSRYRKSCHGACVAAVAGAECRSVRLREAVVVTDYSYKLAAGNAHQFVWNGLLDALCEEVESGVLVPDVVTGENTVAGNYHYLSGVVRVDCEGAAPVHGGFIMPAYVAA